MKRVWELTKKEATKLFSGNCFYCNTLPVTKIKASPYKDVLYNGIDRLDNNKGYTKNNVVSCCKVCNYSKGTMNHTDFLDWISKVHIHSMKERNY